MAQKNLSVGWVVSVVGAFILGRYSGGGGVDTRALMKPCICNCVCDAPQEKPIQQVVVQTAPVTTTRNDDGWHSIDVFYGNTSHLDAVPPPVFGRFGGHKAVQDWYGQVKQDKHVYELLGKKKNGFFVDLASNDARTISNTFALERHHNWTGLCMEPNPIYWHDLAYRNCQVVAAVVGKHRMEEVKFRFTKGVEGGIVGENFDRKPKKDRKEKEPPTPKFTVPLLEILQRYNAPHEIDYLSLDVEGAEEYIMSTFPLDQYRIKVLTVERPTPGLDQFLQRHGFKFLKKIAVLWNETLWAHESFLDEQGKITQ